MVTIRLPPPLHPPNPIFHVVQAGQKIVRIFDPTRHNTQALTFRTFGPIARFDHHQPTPANAPQYDPSGRGIYYAAFTLSSCLVECFGDMGVITIANQEVAYVTVTRDLTLLDLRQSGAMRVGSVAALSKTANRIESQAWSKYFYENDSLYTKVDGIIFFNAHNDEEAIALYERAENGLSCQSNAVIRLDHPKLRFHILDAALNNNLIVEP